MSNKALIAIVGPSGSGKSTSLRNLPPETTRIIDLERKGFPFRSIDKYKVIPCDNIAAVDQAVVAAIADKTVTTIVIESFTKYVELLLKLAQMSYKGYEVWSFYNKQIGNFLDKVKNDHAVVVFTAIDEIVRIPQTDGSESVQRRMSVKGKEWEGKIEKEFLMVLFTEPKKDNTGKIQYYFQTNTDGITSAKTPMEMFTTPHTDNDLNKVLEAAREYYKGQQQQAA